MKGLGLGKASIRTGPSSLTASFACRFATIEGGGVVVGVAVVADDVGRECELKDRTVTSWDDDDTFHSSKTWACGGGRRRGREKGGR